MTTALAATLPSSPISRSNPTGSVRPRIVSSPSTLIPPAVAGRRRGRAEGDLPALEDLVVDRLLDVALVVVAEGLHPARALDHPQRRGVGGQLDGRRLGGLAEDAASPRHERDLDDEVVTGLRSGSGSPGPHREGGVPGAELMLT